MNEDKISMVMAKSWGMLLPEEVIALKKLVQRLPKSPLIINFGAGFGTSSLAIAEERPDAIIHSYDISPSGPLGGLENERNAFDRAKIKYPIQHLEDSALSGIKWRSEVDLVFVDANHSGESVEKDIKAWLPHIKNGGFMVFHDYGSPFWPEVKPMVDKMMLEKYNQILIEKFLTVFEIRK